jgi:hypothetical protein
MKRNPDWVYTRQQPSGKKSVRLQAKIAKVYIRFIHADYDFFPGAFASVSDNYCLYRDH